VKISNPSKGKNKKHKLPVMIEFMEGAANYPIVSNNCPVPPDELGYKHSCTVAVTCVPPGVGKVSRGKMLIRDNAIHDPQSVTFTCSGR
jgi:hypothetical protein